MSSSAEIAVTPRDVHSAVLADLVYEAHRNSAVPGLHSWDRLNTTLGAPRAVGVLGHGWLVPDHMSSQDAALFINPHTREAIIAVRGSDELFREWSAKKRKRKRKKTKQMQALPNPMQY
jgi:hypothetical protein